MLKATAAVLRGTTAVLRGTVAVLRGGAAVLRGGAAVLRGTVAVDSPEATLLSSMALYSVLLISNRTPYPLKRGATVAFYSKTYN